MKNIIITGASQGIGAAVAKSLAQNPEHRLLLLSRNVERLSELQAPNVLVYPFNVVSGDFVRLKSFLYEQFSPVDVLVNNAGFLVNKPFEQQSQEEIRTQWETNFLGPVLMIRTLLPFFTKGAHVVNIGSMGGLQGSVKFSGLSIYSATKSALHTLTECLALELQEKDVKLNALALGAVNTNMLAKAFPKYQADLSASEMGDYVADFALNKSKFFNGKVIPVSRSTP